jgi:hypothetical protein
MAQLTFAEVRRKAVGIHPSKIALTVNSLAITGKATFIDEAINGDKNDAKVVISNTVVLFTSLVIDTPKK